MTTISMNSVEEITTQLRDIADQAQQVFGRYQSAQLNWKPASKEWSIAQCFDHLIVSNTTYFPVVQKIVRGEYKQTTWESMPFLPSFFAQTLINMLKPGNKMPAPKVFLPSQSTIRGSVITDFVSHQYELINMMDSTAQLDLRRIVIASPAAKFLTYSLFDAYRIMLVHERLHFTQAQQVTFQPGFPKNQTDLP